MFRSFLLVMLLGIARGADAGEIPIITLGDAGPDQEIPTDRAFYVRGDATASIEHVQAIVIRRGSPSMFGDNGPSCRELVSELGLDTTLSSASDDDDDAVVIPVPRYDAGVHRAFEIFSNAEGEVRRASVLVSASWQRSHRDENAFKVLVPHDRSFFSAGYGYCLVVVTTEHSQALSNATLAELVDDVAAKHIACGDKSSCDDESLADYETRAARALSSSRAMKRAPERIGEIAALMEEAARVELGQATGLVEVLGHMRDRFFDKTNAMPPVSLVWSEIGVDPFAQAVSTLLAQAGALLPQVKPGGLALFTPDGALQVKAIQLLDDGKTLRVASSKAPTGAQARVLTTTTDSLAIGEGLTLYDLIQLGHKKIRVDKEWITLKALGDGAANVGLDRWTADDSAFLVSAHAQLKRLADFVDLATSGLSCAKRAAPPADASPADAVRRELGDWLVCHKADAIAIENMREHFESLISEDQSWRAAKAKIVAKTRRIVTLTSTAPSAWRVSFASRTWLFSYLTPIVGYAGVLRPDESFGLFYLGAQLHLDPNPVDDVQWRNGLTTKDLRRAIALEVGVAPYGSSFGPDDRYDGPGGLPPIFVGAAFHVLPYTSLTFGGTVLERRNSTLAQEMPHTIFAPYLGLTLQLNIPDLIRTASGPTTDTAVSR
jgi:hypothetical protein